MEGGSRDVLIIGAGPTGLAAALFLAERGVPARLVDQAPVPAATSRAQVVMSTLAGRARWSCWRRATSPPRSGRKHETGP